MHYDRVYYVRFMILVIYINLTESNRWNQREITLPPIHDTDSIDSPIGLRNQTLEFQKQVITVLDGIHCAIGFGIANSMLIEGIDGNIIIDTQESRETAMEVNEYFRNISTKPVIAIIYTHNHADHVFGAEVFAGDNRRNVKVYAHAMTGRLIDIGLSIVEPINIQRSARQFGRYLTPATGHINNGIGLSSGYRNTSTRGLIYPTDTFDNKSWPLTIAGRDFVLYHAPGETDDQIVVYMPNEKVLFAADNFYKSFPNIYSIRGTSTRDTLQWASSLDLMRSLKPTYLIPSHTKPIAGEDDVYDVLTKYRDGIQFVHDQTVRFMNQGLTPDEIVGKNLIRLPKQLVDHPYLQQFYGTLDWSIRGVFDRYLGWFSGKTSDLNPDPPSVRAKNMIELGGNSKNVYRTAYAAYVSGKYQWCLELTEALQQYPDDLNMNDINRLQVLALRKLASFQTSANGRNWYLTKSLEIQGLVNVKQSPIQRTRSIMASSLRNTFKLLAVNFNYEQAEDLNQVVSFHFEDTDETFSIHIRNGIVDVQDGWVDDSTHNIVDMVIRMKEARLWKELLVGQRSVDGILTNGNIFVQDNTGVKIESAEQMLRKFLGLFTI